MADTTPLAPTDAEIVELMRDGYNCRYNDEADHIDFARAVLAKWGAQPVAVPLTDEQIKAMDRRHPVEDLCGWSYRLGIADAEAHHGITPKGGSNAE